MNRINMDEERADESEMAAIIRNSLIDDVQRKASRV